MLLVALGAGRPYRRPARGVEQAELDADGIGNFAHDAAKSVHFADQMTLGDAPNGGIARHLRDQIDIQGEKGGPQSHASRSHGCLATGMPGADHDDVESLV